ncbi:efflux RND transporter periplasmic adaptor subunit [Sinimarinibacterium sp. NLF-5-8]|uniref:efflux RND transporter periplasmic adaptor subunit n=1 Tax=Sinimarinibacterium sp. NLF-5-8 TaxID=2698684 RepID=UPI00137B9A6E|nr:efflux RND transporter periplasmic adaptor subunit [Sinimarinibacterium sp. NLF-5-8]QHS09766.1 efflux RND transporter periplasmic adaptor subunit [Sinimarinibacterium sp. NLF-5-8]
MRAPSALFFSAALLVACQQPAPPAPPPLPKVGTLQIHPRPATVEVEYVAETEASNTAEIRPRVGGLLERQSAVEGQAVKKGQLLFEIDRQPYVVALEQAKAALAQAQVSLKQAKSDLARVEPLAAVNAVSQQELDAVQAREQAGQAAVQAAQAAVRSAELNLEYTRVTAPIDGVMGRAQFRMGGLVTAYQSLLTTVYADNPMYVNFSISEQRMLALQKRPDFRAGRTAERATSFRILLSDGSEYGHPGVLNFVDAAVDRQTGTLPIRLQVANPDGLLRAGQFARVVVAAEQRDDALLVPQSAVQELQGKTSLWVLDAQNKAQMRAVQMGARVGNQWLVEQGLEPEDTVIVDGFMRLRPDTLVDPQPVDVPHGAGQ